MKRYLAEPSEAMKKEMQEKQKQIVRAFRESNFEELMKRTEPKVSDRIPYPRQSYVAGFLPDTQLKQFKNYSFQLIAKNILPLSKPTFFLRRNLKKILPLERKIINNCAMIDVTTFQISNILKSTAKSWECNRECSNVYST